MKKLLKRSEFDQIIDHPGSASVLGVRGDKVLLLSLEKEEFANQIRYEIPGGVVEENETPEQAARREFTEETGYTLGYSFHLLTANPSVGYSNELISIFYASIEQIASEGEFNYGFYSKNQTKELIEKGAITDAHTLAALSIWLNQELNWHIPEVMFICTGNYYRSRFSELYFNHLMRESRVQADSKGLWAFRKINEGMISPYTIAYLNELNLPLGRLKLPEQVELRHFNQVKKVIAMDRSEHYKMMEDAFPEWKDKIDYWEVHDIDFTNPDSALPALKEKVENLVLTFK